MTRLDVQFFLKFFWMSLFLFYQVYTCSIRRITIFSDWRAAERTRVLLGRGKRACLVGQSGGPQVEKRG